MTAEVCGEGKCTVDVGVYLGCRRGGGLRTGNDAQHSPGSICLLTDRQHTRNGQTPLRRQLQRIDFPVAAGSRFNPAIDLEQ